MSKQLTQQEILEKHGNTEMVFRSYYKYMFTYEGETPNGDKIYAHCGGNHDDIYRFEVVAGNMETLKSLDAEDITIECNIPKLNLS